MTIASETRRNDYTLNGVAVVYPYSFRTLAAADLQVVRRSAVSGLETILSYPADFGVSGVGNSVGGAVTLASAGTNGDALTIRRNRALKQETQLTNQGATFPSVAEAALDGLLTIDQQQQDELDRSLKIGRTLDPALYNLTLPVPTAGYVMTGTGSGWTMSALDSSAVALPGAGRLVTTLTAYLLSNAIANVRDYTLAATPIHTDINAADTALTLAAANLPAGGGTIFVPDGIYKIAASWTPPNRPETDPRGASRIKILLSAGAVLKYYGGAATSCINVTNNPGQDGFLTIEGGALDGVAANATANGVRLAAPNVTLRRVLIRRFGGNGVRFDWLGGVTIPPIRCTLDDCEILLNGVGIRADNGKVHGLHLKSTWVEGSNQEGIILSDCGHVVMSGGGSEGNGGVTTTAANLKVLGETDFQAFGAYFESNTNQDHSLVIVDRSATLEMLSAVFYGCLFGGYNVGTAVAIDVGPLGTADVKNFAAYNCMFGESKTYIKIGPRVKRYDIGPCTWFGFNVPGSHTFVALDAANYANGGRGRIAAQMGGVYMAAETFNMPVAVQGGFTTDTQTTTGLASFGGEIRMTGSPVGAANTNRYISGAGNANDWYHNSPTGGKHIFAINGVTVLSVEGVFARLGLTFVPLADATHDLGGVGSRFRDAFLSGKIEIGGALTHKGTTAGFYNVAPVARAAAITSPTAPSAGYVQAEAAAMKTAVDAIRVALTNLGLTS